MIPTPYLADALVALHEASANMKQWRTLHEACGLDLQSTPIERNERTKDSLLSVRESIYTLSDALEGLKRNGTLLTQMNPRQQRTARVMDRVSSALVELKDCADLPEDPAFAKELAAVADTFEDVVGDLEDKSDYSRGAAVQSFVNCSSSFAGFSSVNSGNVSIGFSGGALQSVSTYDSSFRGSGSSSAFSHNVNDEYGRQR